MDLIKLILILVVKWLLLLEILINRNYFIKIILIKKKCLIIISYEYQNIIFVYDYFDKMAKMIFE
jgi:hypothetical protein